MNWFKRFFSKAPPAFNPQVATVDELIAESQRLALEQDAIKEQRRALATLIDSKLKGV